MRLGLVVLLGLLSAAPLCSPKPTFIGKVHIDCSDVDGATEQELRIRADSLEARLALSRKATEARRSAVESLEHLAASGSPSGDLAQAKEDLEVAETDDRSIEEAIVRSRGLADHCF